MRSPRFWDQPTSLTAQLLRPLGALYGAATTRRVQKTGWQAPVPVVCVGNINVGGTGKTPTILALIAELKRQGVSGIHVLSRGYGGTLKGPIQVDPARHQASDVGDEPLLLAGSAPVWVGRDRVASARAACAAGAQILLMDDGHQNPHLIKDFTLITIDAAKGFGNGYCLPAGPLREPVAAGLSRANAVLSIGNDADQQSFAHQWADALAPLPHLRAHIAPLVDPSQWRGRKVFAFAGIGRPEKFFDTLRDLGADLTGTLALGDHQPISPDVWAKMRDQDAPLITTQKDIMRMPAQWREHVEALPVELQFTSPAQWSKLCATIANHIHPKTNR